MYSLEMLLRSPRRVLLVSKIREAAAVIRVSTKEELRSFRERKPVFVETADDELAKEVGISVPYKSLQS